MHFLSVRKRSVSGYRVHFVILFDSDSLLSSSIWHLITTLFWHLAAIPDETFTRSLVKCSCYLERLAYGF